MMLLLIVAGLNTVISLVYYLRVAKTMCIDPEPEGSGSVPLGYHQVLYIVMVAFPILFYGLLPESLARIAHQASANLLP